MNALVCADRVLAPVSVEDEASLHGILELQQTITKLAERLGVTAPDLAAVLTRWQRHRTSSRETEAALVAARLAPIGRIPSRSALIARAAARRIPLSLSEPAIHELLATNVALHKLGAQNRDDTQPTHRRRQPA